MVVYASVHWWTIKNASYLHTEGTTVDAERMALLLATADLQDELLTPPAIAAPAVKAVLDSLEESALAATDVERVTTLFDGAVESLVNLGLPEDATQPSRDSATTRVTAILAEARRQAEVLASAPEAGREVPQRLLEVELQQAEAALLDYMAAPALILRVNELREAVRGVGYGPDSELMTTLARITEELEKNRPNRDLAAELLSTVQKEFQGLRTSLFWSDSVLRWVEVIAWSLAGILSARLISAGKFIGIRRFDAAWNRWWWAKVVLAPLMAVPVVAFLTYLTIDVQSGQTLGIQISLKDQPIEVVVGFSFIVGMFSNQAYKFLQNMANKMLPEDDESRQGKPSSLLTVAGTPFLGRPAVDVQADLETDGFQVKLEPKKTSEETPGTVLEAKPADPKMSKGSEITLVVAEAP